MPHFFMVPNKMERLAGIMQVTEPIYRVLPYLALGIIIAIAVIMFFRSRSKAKSEARPDLSLRLAAASSIIYAAMLLVLFFTQSLFMLYALSLKDSEFSVNVADPGRDAFSLLQFMLAILTCVFAVWQIIVSRWLLKRNIAARNILIGLWLWNFFMLSFPLVSCRTYGLIGLGAGLWTFWVIAIRKDASEKIAKGRKNLSLTKKTVLIFAVILIIPCGVTWQFLTISERTGFSKALSSFSACSEEGITARLEELYIMTGSDDGLTRMIANLLAEKITEKTRISCKVVSAAEPLLKVNTDRAVVLYIESGDVVKPSLPDPALIPKSLRGKIFLPPAGPAAENGFKLKILRAWGNSNFHIRGLSIPQIYLEFQGSVFVEARTDTAIAEASAGEILKNLIPQLEKFRGGNAVRVPEIKLPDMDFPPPLKLKGLKDARLVFAGEGCNPARLEVYSFKKVNYDSDLAIITEALKKRGFNETPRPVCDNQFIFPMGVYNALLDMGRRNGDPVFAGQEVEPERGLLIVPTPRSMDDDYNYEPEFAEDLMKKDLKFFVISHGLSKIGPELRVKAIRDFFSMHGLSVQMVKEAMAPLSHAELSPEEKLICEKGFFKMADTLAAKKDSPDFLKEVQELKSIRAMDSVPVQQLFKKKFADIFCEAKIPDTPDKEGLVRKSFEFPVADTRDFRKIIEISFETPGYDTIWLPVGVYKLDNNFLQLTVGNGTSSTQDRGFDQKVYNCLWDTFSGNRRQTFYPAMSSLGGPALKNSHGKISMQYKLMTELSFDAKKKCVRFDVVFRPQKNSQKK